MKNKWLLLAMVFLFAAPVFAVGPTLGDGVYIGVASEQAMISTAQPLGVEQLGTGMGTLLVATLIVIVFSFIQTRLSGPAASVPERYDKSSGPGTAGNLRSMLVNYQSTGRFRRQAS